MRNFLARQKLTTKIAMALSSLLVVVFAILIISVAVTTKTNIQKLSNEELTAISEKNAADVQSIFDLVDIVGSGAQDYILREYEKAGSAGQNQSGAAFYSPIYGVQYSQSSYEVELYLKENFRSAVAGNENVNSIVAAFEPYAYDSAIQDFSVISAKNVNNSEPYSYGTHSQYSGEPFYTMAKEAGDIVVTPPVEFEGNKVISISYPIIYNNEFKGAIAADINVETFGNKISDITQYSSIYYAVISSDGVVIFNSKNSDRVGENSQDNFTAEVYAQIEENMAGGEAFSIDSTADGTDFTRFYAPIQAGNETWWAVTVIEKSELNAAVRNTLILLIGISVAAFIVIILITIAILHKTLKPIQTVVGAAEQIAQGHFDIQLEATSQDEIGVLTSTFEKTAYTLRNIVEDISSVLDSVAKQNLNVSTSAEYVGELSQIGTSMEQIMNNLNYVLNEIHQCAEQVSSGADQVSSGAQALAQGSTEQASSVEELAATVNEMSQQISVMSSYTQEASSEAEEVGNEMEKSSEKMQDMVQAMSRISDTSKQIEKIIGTIEDIAFQTNILALNAAVEAARAGTAGKGFAVVADEVRNLASKSAEASKNTTSLIEDSITAVRDGIRLTDETSKALVFAVNGAESVVKKINEVSSSFEEQVVAAKQIKQAIDQISSVVQTNSATSQESAAASEELSAQAQNLKSLIDGFELRN